MTKPRILTIDDPVTQYASDVLDNKIIVGPHVRNACIRHLNDMENAHKRGLVLDLTKAKHVINFFYDVLRLNGEGFEGLPFLVEPWQAFVLGSLFGWVHEDTGYRRFKTAYIETGKGSGKSPLAAGIGLYGLVARGVTRGEIYACATKTDQAQILFRDAVAMVDQSPALSKRLVARGSKGQEWQYTYHKNSSFFRTMSSDKKQSGYRPYFALIDEFHEHQNASAVEMNRLGFKTHKQPLLFIITNSGDDAQGPCYEYHDFGILVCEGGRDVDTFFAYICGIEKEEESRIFEDESIWPKANPSIGTTISYEYIRELVQEAKGLPSKESWLKRYYFCLWVGAVNPWISSEVWKGASQDYDMEMLQGRSCIAGLDLSSTTDLTACVLAFEPTDDDPVIRLLPFFWLPNINLKEKQDQEKVPYPTWKKLGFLFQTPGPAISKLHIIKFIADELMEKFVIKKIAYDRWRIKDLRTLADDHNIELPEMEEFGQGYQSMAPAIEEFETKLINHQVTHNNNPVMNYCASTAVCVMDDAGNRKLSKRKAKGRIDGIVAATMAIGTMAHKEDTTSVYEERGILFV